MRGQGTIGSVKGRGKKIKYLDEVDDRFQGSAADSLVAQSSPTSTELSPSIVLFHARNDKISV